MRLRSGIWLPVAAALACAPVLPARAAQLCDGACTFSLDFASGGAITASQGATLIFGSGGALILGDGGSITPGDGGSVTPEGADMSGGGTVVLGPGGSIQFGASGSLASGDAGGIDVVDGGSLAVQGATDVTVHSDASLHLGDLTSQGSIELDAGGDIDGCDTATPIHLTMADGDSGTRIAIDTAADLSLGALKGDPTVTANAGGSVTLCVDGGSAGDGGGTGTGGGPAGSSSGSVCVTSGSGGDASCSDFSSAPLVLNYEPEPLVVTDPPAPEAGGGAFGGWELALFGALGLARSRRRRLHPNG